MEDLEATIKFYIEDAISINAHKTRIKKSPEIDEMIDNIYNRLNEANLFKGDSNVR